MELRKKKDGMKIARPGRRKNGLLWKHFLTLEDVLEFPCNFLWTLHPQEEEYSNRESHSRTAGSPEFCYSPLCHSLCQVTSDKPLHLETQILLSLSEKLNLKKCGKIKHTIYHFTYF